jgi:iron complex outermembrane receptor protein
VQWSFRDVTKHLVDATGPRGYVDYWALSPKFGVLYQATPTAQFFANASHANEPPLLFELTAPANDFPSVDDLKSQDAWQFEIGTRGEAWKDLFRWELSLYDIELWDEIRNVNLVPFPGAPFTIPAYTNIPRSRHWGVELGVDATLATNVARSLGASFGDRVRFVDAYTYGNFRYVDDPVFGDNEIPGLPSNFLAGEIKWETDFGLWIAPGYESSPTSWFVNSENTVDAPAYALFNLRSGYVNPDLDLEVFFEARNLLNEDYVSAVQVDSAAQTYFEPGDGRAFYGGVQWRWF